LYKTSPKEGLKPPQARVIMMQEYIPSLINMNYVNLLTEQLVKSENSCIKIGKSVAKSGYIEMRKPYLKYAKVLEGDWSEFDQSVKRAHIVAAMCIMRQCFPAGDEHDKRFMYMLSGLVCKKVVQPGGLIFQLSDGVPSGTPWTALLDSTVNWLVLRDLVNKTVTGCDLKDVGFQIGGDDFCIFLPEGASIDLVKLVKRADEYHGMTLRGDDLILKDCFAEENRKAPSFYKTVFVNGMPTVRFDDFVKRLMLPERYPKNAYDALLHLEDQMASGILNDDLIADFACSYRTYLYEAIFTCNGRAPPPEVLKSVSVNAYLMIKKSFEEVILSSSTLFDSVEDKLWIRDDKGIYYDTERLKDENFDKAIRYLLNYTCLTNF
jgi:hypothetical protein